MAQWSRTHRHTFVWLSSTSVDDYASFNRYDLYHLHQYINIRGLDVSQLETAGSNVSFLPCDQSPASPSPTETHLAGVEVHRDALKGRNWLLLLWLLALSALVQCMLGLLVERIGWGRLSWHVADVQSNSLHRTERAGRSHKGQTHSSRESWDFIFMLFYILILALVLVFLIAEVLFIVTGTNNLAVGVPV